MKLSLSGLLVLGSLAGLPTTITGCSKAQFAQFETVASIILTDLAQHKTIDQIETDVGAVSPAGADIVAVTYEVLKTLIDFGEVPASVLPDAQAMSTKLSAQIAARAPTIK